MAKVSKCCIVKSFCGFQNLRKGCLTIAILSVLIALMNIIVSRVVFTIQDLKYLAAVYVCTAISVLFSGLTIVFGLILYAGSRQPKYKLIKIWLIFACIYVGYSFILFLLLLLYVILHSDEVSKGRLGWALWDILMSLVNGGIMAYCALVVNSYRLELKAEEESKKGDNKPDEE